MIAIAFTMLMKLLLVLSIPFLIISCTSEVIITLPEQEKELTLNCILNPDSDTVKVWISYSKPILDTANFEQIDNVTVTLIEGYKTVAQFTKSDSTAFVLPFKVNPGKTYKIVASTDTRSVWAETRVPEKFEASFIAIKDYVKSFDYIVSINRKPSEQSVYWISSKGFSWYDGKPFYDISPALYSDCSFADDFNRLVEESSGYMYEYEYYIRVNSKEALSDTINVQFHPSNNRIEDGPQEVFALSVDYHLDKYMKSSLLMEDIDSYAEDVPIVYAPFPMYSNINGGTGIFGSYTSVSKVFTKD